MKSKAKVLLCIFLSVFIFEAAGFAKDKDVVPKKYQVKAYTKAVEKELGHKSEEYEKSIINTVYTYYANACQNNWDKESWKEAVQKAAELCRNKIAIAAAKAGEFGEKLLKALIQSTKEAADSVSDWLDKKSQEYNKQSEKDTNKNKLERKDI